MLDVAVKFLATELNAFLAARAAIDSSGVGGAVVSRIGSATNGWDIPEEQILVSLINVEEERAIRPQVPQTVYLDGAHVQLEPELIVNLHLLFAVNFRDYEAALRQLAHVLTFFQARPVFTRERYPGLDPRIGRLAVDLISLTYEQLNQLWSFLGAKQLPSAVYRVRLVALQDREPMAVHPPILEVHVDTEVL